jgi:hypothetical protein
MNTIDQLYGAFKRLDAEGMADCYATSARFEDEAFTLKGRDEIAGMWRMLIDAVKAKGHQDWALEWRDVHVQGQYATAHWEPRYRFSASGRLVHNIIDAEFELDEHGLIVSHRDRFDFWRWSRQALGAPGLLLGWTPWLRSKVRKQAMTNLKRYLDKR